MLLQLLLWSFAISGSIASSTEQGFKESEVIVSKNVISLETWTRKILSGMKPTFPVELLNLPNELLKVILDYFPEQQVIPSIIFTSKAALTAGCKQNMFHLYLFRKYQVSELLDFGYHPHLFRLERGVNYFCFDPENDGKICEKFNLEMQLWNRQNVDKGLLNRIRLILVNLARKSKYSEFGLHDLIGLFDAICLHDNLNVCLQFKKEIPEFNSVSLSQLPDLPQHFSNWLSLEQFELFNEAFFQPSQSWSQKEMQTFFLTSGSALDLNLPPQRVAGFLQAFKRILKFGGTRQLGCSSYERKTYALYKYSLRRNRFCSFTTYKGSL